MLLILDLETTTQWNDKYPKGNPSPFIPENYLVSAGWWDSYKRDYYYDFYNHNDLTHPAPLANLQQALSRTSLLVAHNAKFELSWLKAIGLEYNGKLADTMLREYILARGQKLSVSLEESCKRREVALKKSELIEGYLKQKIGFEAIPMPLVEEYGLADVRSCKELYEHQLEIIPEHLWPTINLTEEFCRCLTDIESNGIAIDVNSLKSLEDEYRAELQTLKSDLSGIVKEVMGNAAEINLDSPEQLSQVLYSRRVTDKKKWKEVFNLGSELRGSVSKPKRRPKMSTLDFVNNIKAYTEPVYRMDIDASILEPRLLDNSNDSNNIKSVSGHDPIFKRRGANLGLQPRGSSEGVREKSKIAGFKFIPSGPQDVAVGGFKTDGGTLELLAERASGRAKDFLEGIKRANQIETYLSTFVEGIKRGLGNDYILHPSYMQFTTATGRLSSRNPNFQNQPRGNTFPVRRCVVSRFPGGCILSGDAKQLEFRIAGELSGDRIIYEDVVNGMDVHSATSEHTGFNRQDSKPHTFAPVYGASERGKAENISRYYKYFKERYAGLFEAHVEWGNQVLNEGYYRLPSGREFVYPGTFRYPGGGFSNRTIIANYPVQAFATADLMPIFCIETWKRYLKAGLKSLVILEVHDDVTVDVYPGELEIAAKLMIEAFNAIPEECIKRYGYELKMPLEIELKVGPNWLQQEEYHVSP